LAGGGLGATFDLKLHHRGNKQAAVMAGEERWQEKRKLTTTPLLHDTALQFRVDVLDETPGLLIWLVNCGVEPGIPGKRGIVARDVRMRQLAQLQCAP
jgi:hypothetical protein